MPGKQNGRIRKSVLIWLDQSRVVLRFCFWIHGAVVRKKEKFLARGNATVDQPDIRGLGTYMT